MGVCVCMCVCVCVRMYVCVRVDVCILSDYRSYCPYCIGVYFCCDCSWMSGASPLPLSSRACVDAPFLIGGRHTRHAYEICAAPQLAGFEWARLSHGIANEVSMLTSSLAEGSC